MIAAIPPTSEATGERAEITGQVTLTPRQIEIVINLMRKDSNIKAAAESLFIEVQTVEKHLEEIYRRTGCRKRHEAILWVVANYSSNPDVLSALRSYAAA